MTTRGHEVLRLSSGTVLYAAVGWYVLGLWIDPLLGCGIGLVLFAGVEWWSRRLEKRKD